MAIFVEGTLVGMGLVLFVPAQFAFGWLPLLELTFECVF